MVVVHLPYTPVIPTLGVPEVSRTRLVGGAGFEIREQYYYYEARAERKQYTIDQSGYIDISYELAGELDGNSRLLLHLTGYDSSEEHELDDLSPFLDVEVWSGSGWIEQSMQLDTQLLDLPVAWMVDDKRQVTIRFRARAEFIFEIPWAEVY